MPPSLRFTHGLLLLPMGWNSYDAYGSSVTEDEVLANARYMKEHLLSFGWQYVVVDYRWYDPDAKKHSLNGEQGDALAHDDYGRLIPAENRFPSAASGSGFRGLADQVHAMGLKFGIHMMRGLPAQAFKAKSPILDSSFTAADASNGKCSCTWCKDMVDVQDTPAGQAWYDAEAKQWAEWQLDFVKVDDLSTPYHTGEIEMIRRAIDKCGRPIVFSTSPGETPVQQADHIILNANQWRISNDFWDNWKSLNHNFDLFAAWHSYASPGHWPDGDMIPFGRIGIRSVGHNRQSAFTVDEETTLMSLWALESSPLILGSALPDLDPATLKVITNPAIIAIDQDPLGEAGHRVTLPTPSPAGIEIWSKPLQGGGTAFGVFNRSNVSQSYTIDRTALGMAEVQTTKNAWNAIVSNWEKPLPVTIPPHGCQLFITPVK